MVIDHLSVEITARCWWEMKGEGYTVGLLQKHQVKLHRSVYQDECIWYSRKLHTHKRMSK